MYENFEAVNKRLSWWLIEHLPEFNASPGIFSFLVERATIKDDWVLVSAVEHCGIRAIIKNEGGGNLLKFFGDWHVEGEDDLNAAFSINW
jgi:hypothetical protein